MRKLARFEILRNWIIYLFNSQNKRWEISDCNSSCFKDIDVSLVISNLRTKGYYSGINLPQAILREILEFANHKICYGNREPNLGFYCSNKKQAEVLKNEQFSVGSYLHETEMCPAINKLKTDPGLLAIAAQFLGTNPIHIASELVWSFPISAEWVQQRKLAQVFHYDMDDYRFIKFFFYLTDVDMSSGPHVCIQGSHRNKKFLHQLIGLRCANIDEQKIVDCYGTENVVNICGPAGFGFVEDPFCFHKGTPPSDKARLLLQIEFAANSYRDIRNFY